MEQPDLQGAHAPIAEEITARDMPPGFHACWVPGQSPNARVAQTLNIGGSCTTTVSFVVGR